MACVLLGLAGCTNGERTTPIAEPATVPSVSGRPLAEAVAAVRDAGLTPDARNSDGTLADADACPAARVVAQDSPAGSSLVRGSAVELRIAVCVTPAPR